MSAKSPSSQQFSPSGPLSEGLEIRGGKYHVRKLLGRGGTGWVYLAQEPLMEREVVIKIIDPELIDDDVTKSALVYEARAAAKLEHENIIRVFTMETEEIDGFEFTYIVMEYANRGDLRDAFPELVKTDADRCRIMLDVLRGLEYAHKKGFIHRDLKPDNMFVKDKTVKLGDLGTVKSIGEKTRRYSTQGIMTPVYSSPEQLRFEGLDERSDIYTLGVIFFEIMTGKRPYKNFDDHLSDDPPPKITDLVEKLDSGISRVIAKMMAKRPEDRYQNIGEILDDLRRLPVIAEAGLLPEPAAEQRPSAMNLSAEKTAPQAPVPAAHHGEAAPRKGLDQNTLILVLLAVLVVAVTALLVLTLLNK